MEKFVAEIAQQISFVQGFYGCGPGYNNNNNLKFSKRNISIVTIVAFKLIYYGLKIVTQI